MSLLTLILVLVVIGVVLALIQKIPDDILHPTIKRLIYAVAILFVVIWLISILVPGVADIRLPAR